MSDFAVTSTRLFEGVWEGLITRASKSNLPPEIEVLHLGHSVDGVSVRNGPGEEEWTLRIALSPEMISDGVQTFLINDARAGSTLDKFSLICGEALDGDIRAEVDLLREELDMLKRAFRRHCLETA